ncbi:N-terminal glutamine amidase-domain-containing protein [Ganoderma leucocontextum]|nr:N-terminal glutamine amidase-domain-containing protein [Ganoderma leucocontextum]
MSNSVLSSFDPLATHPFTNNSGLLPKPAAPSQYPHPVPSSSAHAPAQGPIILTTTPVHAPQPKRASPVKTNSRSSAPKPIFVPFRPERGSPDLEDILLKKKFSDAFQGKAQWGIDQVTLAPAPAPIRSSGRQGKAHVYTSCYCEENIYLLVQNFLAEANAQASRGLAWPWETYVVFISNPGKTVALWSQTLRAPNVVVWDYHVVLVLRPAASGPAADHQSHNFLRRNGDTPRPPHVRPRVAQAPAAQPIDLENGDPRPRDVSVDHVENLNVGWVYDFDTTLAVPCSCRDYVTGTFPYALNDNLKARIDDRFLSLFRVIPADVYVDNFASDRSHMIIHAPRSEVGLSTNGISTVAGAAIGPSDAGEGLGDGGGADGPDLKMVGRGHEGITAVQYSSPPPPYPPLRGVKAREQGIVHNLMESFVAMEPDAISSRAAEEDEDLPERDLRTSARVGSPDDAGNATTTRAGDRSARAAVQYGQVMDVGAFVRWLSAADDASAPRWGS